MGTNNEILDNLQFNAALNSYFSMNKRDGKWIKAELNCKLSKLSLLVPISYTAFLAVCQRHRHRSAPVGTGTGDTSGTGTGTDRP